VTASPLTVQHAEVHTATVSIRTLTIDRKQVTLATFRQLREESVVTWEGELAGVPWGAVNYCPDKKACEGIIGGHLHVVWQKDSELRRATEGPPPRKCGPYSEVADMWLARSLLDGSRPPKEWEGEEWVWRGGRLGCWVNFVAGLPAIHCPLPGSWGTIGYPLPPGKDLTDHQREVLEKVIEDGGDWAKSKDATALAKEVADDIREEHRRWTEHHKRWRELEALPQLFIAT
jgi:hypothetical protein